MVCDCLVPAENNDIGVLISHVNKLVKASRAAHLHGGAEEKLGLAVINREKLPARVLLPHPAVDSRYPPLKGLHHHNLFIGSLLHVAGEIYNLPGYSGPGNTLGFAGIKHNIERIEKRHCKGYPEAVDIVAVKGPEDFRARHRIADGYFINIGASPDSQHNGCCRDDIFAAPVQPPPEKHKSFIKKAALLRLCLEGHIGKQHRIKIRATIIVINDQNAQERVIF